MANVTEIVCFHQLIIVVLITVKLGILAGSYLISFAIKIYSHARVLL